MPFRSSKQSPAIKIKNVPSKFSVVPFVPIFILRPRNQIIMSKKSRHNMKNSTVFSPSNLSAPLTFFCLCCSVLFYFHAPFISATTQPEASRRPSTAAAGGGLGLDVSAPPLQLRIHDQHVISLNSMLSNALVLKIMKIVSHLARN